MPADADTARMAGVGMAVEIQDGKVGVFLCARSRTPCLPPGAFAVTFGIARTLAYVPTPLNHPHAGARARARARWYC